MGISIINIIKGTFVYSVLFLAMLSSGIGAPSKGRLEDPVKVNAATEAIINSALAYLA